MEQMIPWEREAFIILLKQWLESERVKLEQRIQNSRR
jgi:hypothetical protein